MIELYQQSISASSQNASASNELSTTHHLCNGFLRTAIAVFQIQVSTPMHNHDLCSHINARGAITLTTDNDNMSFTLGKPHSVYQFKHVYWIQWTWAVGCVLDRATLQRKWVGDFGVDFQKGCEGACSLYI